MEPLCPEAALICSSNAFLCRAAISSGQHVLSPCLWLHDLIAKSDALARQCGFSLARLLTAGECERQPYRLHCSGCWIQPECTSAQCASSIEIQFNDAHPAASAGSYLGECVVQGAQHSRNLSDAQRQMRHILLWQCPSAHLPAIHAWQEEPMPTCSSVPH